jgi:hypothetical protein
MNLKGRGRKKAWPNLRQYHSLHGRTEETRKRHEVMKVNLRADILIWDIPNMKHFGEFLLA